MADDKYKLEKTRVADFVADSMHKIANHSSEAEGIHKQADYARKIASTRIVNVGTKAVLRPPFEVDGQWYYETKNLVGVETHGPFASAAEALKDIAGNIGGTKKAFELRWAKDREARFHPEGEWQLRFFEAARAFDRRRLKLGEWLSQKNAPDEDETIYTFHMQGIVDGPLASLIAAGIRREDIEVQISWCCPRCGNNHSAEVELITHGGHKAEECPLACPICGRFTAIYYPETGQVQPRNDAPVDEDGHDLAWHKQSSLCGCIELGSVWHWCPKAQRIAEEEALS